MIENLHRLWRRRLERTREAFLINNKESSTAPANGEDGTLVGTGNIVRGQHQLLDSTGTATALDDYQDHHNPSSSSSILFYKEERRTDSSSSPSSRMLLLNVSVDTAVAERENRRKRVQYFRKIDEYNRRKQRREEEAAEAAMALAARAQQQLGQGQGQQLRYEQQSQQEEGESEAQYHHEQQQHLPLQFRRSRSSERLKRLLSFSSHSSRSTRDTSDSPAKRGGEAATTTADDVAALFPFREILLRNSYDISNRPPPSSAAVSSSAATASRTSSTTQRPSSAPGSDNGNKSFSYDSDKNADERRSSGTDGGGGGRLSYAQRVRSSVRDRESRRSRSSSPVEHHRRQHHHDDKREARPLSTDHTPPSSTTPLEEAEDDNDGGFDDAIGDDGNKDDSMMMNTLKMAKIKVRESIDRLSKVANRHQQPVTATTTDVEGGGGGSGVVRDKSLLYARYDDARECTFKPVTTTHKGVGNRKQAYAPVGIFLDEVNATSRSPVTAAATTDDDGTKDDDNGDNNGGDDAAAEEEEEPISPSQRQQRPASPANAQDQDNQDLRDRDRIRKERRSKALSDFVQRQEDREWRKQKQLEETREKEEYESWLGKKHCPSCGIFQSYEQAKKDSIFDNPSAALSQQGQAGPAGQAGPGQGPARAGQGQGPQKTTTSSSKEISYQQKKERKNKCQSCCVEYVGACTWEEYQRRRKKYRGGDGGGGEEVFLSSAETGIVDHDSPWKAVGVCCRCQAPPSGCNCIARMLPATTANVSYNDNRRTIRPKSPKPPPMSPPTLQHDEPTSLPHHHHALSGRRASLTPHLSSIVKSVDADVTVTHRVVDADAVREMRNKLFYFAAFVDVMHTTIDHAAHAALLTTSTGNTTSSSSGAARQLQALVASKENPHNSQLLLQPLWYNGRGGEDAQDRHPMISNMPVPLRSLLATSNGNVDQKTVNLLAPTTLAAHISEEGATATRTGPATVCVSSGGYVYPDRAAAFVSISVGRVVYDRVFEVEKVPVGIVPPKPKPTSPILAVVQTAAVAAVSSPTSQSMRRPGDVNMFDKKCSPDRERSHLLRHRHADRYSRGIRDDNPPPRRRHTSPSQQDEEEAEEEEEEEAAVDPMEVRVTYLEPSKNKKLATSPPIKKEGEKEGETYIPSTGTNPQKPSETEQVYNTAAAHPELLAQLRKSRVKVSPLKERLLQRSTSSATTRNHSSSTTDTIAKAVDVLYLKTVEIESALLSKETSAETLEMLKTIAQQTNALLSHSKMIKRTMAFETPERVRQRSPLVFRAFDTDYLDFEIYDLRTNNNKNNHRSWRSATEGRGGAGAAPTTKSNSRFSTSIKNRRTATTSMAIRSVPVTPDSKISLSLESKRVLSPESKKVLFEDGHDHSRNDLLSGRDTRRTQVQNDEGSRGRSRSADRRPLHQLSASSPLSPLSPSAHPPPVIIDGDEVQGDYEYEYEEEKENGDHGDGDHASPSSSPSRTSNKRRDRARSVDSLQERRLPWKVGLCVYCHCVKSKCQCQVRDVRILYLQKQELMNYGRIIGLPKPGRTHSADMNKRRPWKVGLCSTCLCGNTYCKCGKKLDNHDNDAQKPGAEQVTPQPVKEHALSIQLHQEEENDQETWPIFVLESVEEVLEIVEIGPEIIPFSEFVSEDTLSLQLVEVGVEEVFEEVYKTVEGKEERVTVVETIEVGPEVILEQPMEDHFVSAIETIEVGAEVLCDWPPALTPPPPQDVVNVTATTPAAAGPDPWRFGVCDRCHCQYRNCRCRHPSPPRMIPKEGLRIDLEQFLDRVDGDLEQRKRNMKQLKRDVRREREEKLWAASSVVAGAGAGASSPSSPLKSYRGGGGGGGGDRGPRRPRSRSGGRTAAASPVLAFMGRMERDLYERKQASPQKYVVLPEQQTRTNATADKSSRGPHFSP